jgi:hypothetical protein
VFVDCEIAELRVADSAAGGHGFLERSAAGGDAGDGIESGLDEIAGAGDGEIDILTD